MSGPLAVPPTRIVPVHGTRGAAVPPQERLRLGDALVQAGVITPTQLDQCLAAQRGSSPPRRLGAVVVERGLATDVDVARGLASILGFEYVDPATLDVPVDVIRRLPRDCAEALGAVPVGAGPTWVRVAVADPDRAMLDAVRDATGVLNVSLAVATPTRIAAALERFWTPGYDAPAVPVAGTPEPQPEIAVPVASGWEYAFVTDDVTGAERALARLGADGWEAVGMTANGTGVTVLLKRAR